MCHGSDRSHNDYRPRVGRLLPVLSKPPTELADRKEVLYIAIGLAFPKDSKLWIWAQFGAVRRKLGGKMVHVFFLQIWVHCSPLGRLLLCSENVSLFYFNFQESSFPFWADGPIMEFVLFTCTCWQRVSLVLKKFSYIWSLEISHGKRFWQSCTYKDGNVYKPVQKKL